MAKVKFLDFVPSHSAIRDEALSAIANVYDNNWYILGKEVEKFENSYAEFSGTKFCSGVGNGLDALYLSLKALGIGPGDEVIVPSNTYIATVLAVSYLGATPVFVEPCLDTYNINPTLISEKLTKKTKAIIPVHLYGQPCEMDKIMALAKEARLFVVEDNAQSQGAYFKNKMTGSFGDINATSFYPGKNLGALGDAGAITTDNEQLNKAIRTLRNYGSEQKYYNKIIGHNSRLDEIQAAVLSVKLKYLKRWTDERISIAQKYRQGLSGINGLTLPSIIPGGTHVYHQFIVRTKFRDELKSYLAKNEIETLIHYPIPPHLQEAYSFMNFNKGDFPISEEIASTVLSLPIYIGIKDEDIDYVVSRIKDFFASL